jgi:hypothetical protein
MQLLRRTFTNRIASLDFTMKAPADFVDRTPASKKQDFAKQSAYAPLLALVLPSDQVSIDVSARPGHGNGTVREWFTQFCIDHEIRLLSIGPTYVGGLRKNHPVIMAGGLRGEDDKEEVMSFVALEDGGRFMVARATCTRELEPRYMSILEESIYSLELLCHKGPTARLDDDGAKYEIEILQDDPQNEKPSVPAAWAW